MRQLRKQYMPRQVRTQVLPVEIKGFISQFDGTTVPFMVWDVSVNGIGILLSDCLVSGEVLTINIGAPYAISILCSVVWCELLEADYDFQEPSYRCGLITLVNEKQLQPIIDHIQSSLSL
ncbi:MAG: PilZ domain-containing protein [Proteobacteria bacterium]|nr:PilZ domain-containing protein [Pseudomonadota bacterium]